MYYVIMYLFPNAIIGQDFALQDDGDGRGAYIAFWNEAKLGPQPTVEELAAAASASELSTARNAKITAINSAADRVSATLTVGYPDFEVQTWPIQRAEVLAWQANSTAPTPYIDAIAGYRGANRTDQLTHTVARVAYFTSASAYIIGTRQKYMDLAAAATSQADLDAIVINYELPTS